ncbi:hydrophobic/amphiphilic exporter-1, HAE1 family [Pelagirhabdus alkalitolerans]|uniref:Hydrophobic/amphiphilic exporter-1, HAE1 family n=1 Tax=Pelagirhabdus alkalitolerans TaxID=1612202 RepID=A0A1G6GGB7_9BACI|nr:efflux RND transporter permease subunit [Pelagirhabdus alkalitolerans]SDB80873.1 hydrophobic/amphiphilic exporter-1, HAE1 family [Pelagirhabdus alkalitolerans]
MRLVETSVKRPVGVIMIVLAIIATGFVSVQNLAIDLLPDIDLPVAVVSVSYEEAAPEDVERQISEPLEQALGTIEGIDSIQTQSNTGSSTVIMMFDMGTNLDNALLEVRERVDQVRPMLPDDAGDANVLRFNPNQMPIMAVSLSGEDLVQLQDLADDQVIPALERQSGVADVTMEGGQSRVIDVTLDESKLMQYGVSAQDVMESLGGANQAGSVGTVRSGDENLQVRVDGTYQSVEEIEETIVQTEQGSILHVSDLATVEDTFTTPDTTLVNGQDAVVLSLMRQSGTNTVEVSDNVLDSMDEIEASLPGDVELDLVYDTSEFIRLSINSVVQNILLGGLFAILVLLLFLKSLRATIVIGVSIPIAIIATFSLIYFTGETLNILTMGGLALGIGMMVDSSIVILENIVSYRQRGYSKFEAAKLGASELAPAVIASTTTTLVVFLPMVFVSGIAAELFIPLATTVAFALIAALVVSITLVPMLSSKLLVDVNQESNKRRYWFDRFLERLANGYERVLKQALRLRKTTLFVTLLLLVGSLLLIPFIGSEFIPEGDQGQISVDVETPAGSQAERTEEIAMEVDEVISEYDDIIRINNLSIAGGDMMSGMMGMGGGGGNSANFTLELVPASDRDMTTEDLVQELSENTTHIAGADINVSAMDDMQMGDPISIELQGPEHDVLNELSTDVLAEIEEIDGIYSPSTSIDEVQPQLDIQVDSEVAARYGLADALVMNQVETRMSSQTVMRYREDGNEMDVRVQYPEEDYDTIADIRNMMIQSPMGMQVPLHEIASLEHTQAPANLQRGNQQPLVTISSDVVGADLGTVSSEIEERLDGMDWPDEYTYSIGGQAEDMEEAFGELALVLLLSIFLVYVVMAVQFENFLMPFIIMFSLPVSIIGVLFGYFITGTPLSIVGFIGIIMLAGIVVNNAIVLVDYTNILRRREIDRYDAIIEAGRSRLRPILMTTLTTVLAMIPLGLGLGEGAEMQQPMAVTVIFGLTIASIFTLVLIPVIYTYVDNVSTKWKNRKA